MKQGRRITFEYVLLGGVNDALTRTPSGSPGSLRGIPAKVNLIPYNENPGLGFAAPAPARVDRVPGRLVAPQRDRGGPQEPRAATSPPPAASSPRRAARATRAAQRSVDRRRAGTAARR